MIDSVDRPTTLGSVVKELRQRAKLNRGDVVARMKARGVSLARTTLQSWEEGRGKKFSTDWNPVFFHALADSLGVSDIYLLWRMGFPVVPDGYSLEDMELLVELRKFPATKRKQIVQSMNAILDNLGIGPGDDES